MNKYLLTAIDCALEKDWNAAISNINKALLLNHGGSKGEASLYCLRGTMWHQQGNLDKALSDYSKAISLDSTRVSLYGNRARTLAEQGDFDLALLDCDKAIEFEPNNYVSHQIRGEVRLEREEYDLAISDLNRSMELQPANLSALELRAKAYRGLGKTELAEADEKELDMEGSKNNDKALASLDAAIESEPNSFILYQMRGGLRLARKDFESAIEDFTKALELNDEKLVALQSRAEAYRALGKIDLSEADEKKYQNEMLKDK